MRLMEGCMPDTSPTDTRTSRLYPSRWAARRLLSSAALVALVTLTACGDSGLSVPSQPTVQAIATQAVSAVGTAQAAASPVVATAQAAAAPLIATAEVAGPPAAATVQAGAGALAATSVTLV